MLYLQALKDYTHPQHTMIQLDLLYRHWKNIFTCSKPGKVKSWCHFHLKTSGSTFTNIDFAINYGIHIPLSVTTTSHFKINLIWLSKANQLFRKLMKLWVIRFVIIQAIVYNLFSVEGTFRSDGFVEMFLFHSELPHPRWFPSPLFPQTLNF